MESRCRSAPMGEHTFGPKYLGEVYNKASNPLQKQARNTRKNMAQEPTSATAAALVVNDFYFSAPLIQPDQGQPAGDFRVSDATYAEELQLQEALMASAKAESNRAVQESGPSTTEIGSSSASTSGCSAENEVDVATGDGQTPDNFRKHFLTASHLLAFKPIFFLVSSLFFSFFHHFSDKVKSIICKARKKHSGNMAQHPTPTAASSTLFVDDFYLSSLLIQPQDQPSGDFQVSDSMYADQLQLQEALMACAETVFNNSVEETPPSTTEIGSGSVRAENKDGEAIGEGKIPDNFCEICAEMRGNHEVFRSVKCSHAFCSNCISKHVAVKIQENSRVVTCPGLNCKRVLEADECRGLVAVDVMKRWDEVRSEPLIAASERFYCPLKDCSALMVTDNGGEGIRESECPVCRRLFCAACYFPLHSAVGSKECQMLEDDEKGREDRLLRELAAEKKWRRCPQCINFGNSNPVMPFGSATGTNDQMNPEDSMAEDTVQASTTAFPVLGQSAMTPSPSPLFVFDAPAPSGASPFQFGGQQNPVTPETLSSFEVAGSLDVRAGRVFSLGSGGIDKSNRRTVKVKHLRRKK